MSDRGPDHTGKIGLPLLSEVRETAAPEWHGWQPVTALPLPEHADAPEPHAPQGMYGQSAEVEGTAVLHVSDASALPRAELLAPAGGLDAGFAAFHFGADAIYLG